MAATACDLRESANASRREVPRNATAAATARFPESNRAPVLSLHPVTISLCYHYTKAKPEDASSYPRLRTLSSAFIDAAV